jgi:hypothetical protein
MTEESVAADEGGYQFQTSTGQPESTTSTSTRAAGGYDVYSTTSASQAQTTTEQQARGYSYQDATTEFQTEVPTDATTNRVESSTATESSTSSGVGGYNYETSTLGTTESTTQAAFDPSVTERTYLPPQTEAVAGGYANPASVASVLSNDAQILTLPSPSQTQEQEEQTTVPSSFSSTIGSTSVSSGGYSLSYDIPTPPPSSSAAATSFSPSLDDRKQREQPGHDLREGVGVADTSKVSKILEEIQNGGAEVRDENGNKLGFEELKKLILANPDGALSLQKAEDDVNASTSPTSGTTTQSSDDSTPLSPSSQGGGYGGYTSEDQKSETVTPQQSPDGPQLVTTSGQGVGQNLLDSFLPVVEPQRGEQQVFHANPNVRNEQDYFTNARLTGFGQPGFQISTPSQEYENHIVEKNTVDQQQNTNAFSTPGYSSSSYQRDLLDPRQGPGPQNQQRFATVLNTQLPEGYYQTQSPQVQESPRGQQQHVHQSFSPQADVGYSTLPSFPGESNTQSQYYQNHAQPQYTQQQQQQGYNSYTSTTTQGHSNSYNSPLHPHPQQPDRFAEPPRAAEYLPPPQTGYSSTPTHQIQRDHSSSSPTQDLTNNDIGNANSNSPGYPSQQPFVSSSSRSSGKDQRGRDVDVRIVPAILVDRHTKVEHERLDEAPIVNSFTPAAPRQVSDVQFSRNFANYYEVPTSSSSPTNSQQQPPYTSQSEHAPVAHATAPRLNPFTLDDAIPKREKFTTAESKSMDEVMRFPQPGRQSQIHQDQSRQHSLMRESGMLSHFSGASGRGFTGRSNEDNHFYPGKDNSLGISLTYN